MPDIRPRILAIDDVPTNLLVLATGLSNEFNLQIATSGASGIAIARAQPPDLILLDVMMPEMDGYEAFQTLRSDPALQAIPIIFVSALTDMGSEVKGLELGADDYLHKPVIVSVARQRIRNLLERQALRRAVERHRSELQELVEERTRHLVDATRQLRMAKEAAEAASRGKSAFLSSISFELRSRLNIVLGLGALLQRKLTDQDLAAMNARIMGAGQDLLAKFDDMIQISAMEGDIGPSDGVDFPLAPLLQRVEVSLRARAHAKGLALETGIDSAVPARLRGPSALLIQLLENLVGDAIAHAGRGLIAVRASLLSRGGATVRLRFEVTNTGDADSAAPTEPAAPGRPRASDGVVTALSTEPDSAAAFSLELARMLGGEVGSDDAVPGGRRWATACFTTVDADGTDVPATNSY